MFPWQNRRGLYLGASGSLDCWGLPGMPACSRHRLRETASNRFACKFGSLEKASDHWDLSRRYLQNFHCVRDVIL